MMNDRYIRNIQFEGIGIYGQKKLLESSVAIVGQGALGCADSEYLVRAGVGHIRIIDADRVEMTNLQRQILYDENDIGKEKVFAAAEHMRRINSTTEVIPIEGKLNQDNAAKIFNGVDLVIDATDNFEARMTINKACVQAEIPWIYGGAVGSAGMTMNIVPGGPCFMCINGEEPPKPGEYPVAATAGVMCMLPSLVSAIQCSEAMKILVGADNVRDTLLSFDLWKNKFEEIKIIRNPWCKVCGNGKDS